MASKPISCGGGNAFCIIAIVVDAAQSIQDEKQPKEDKKIITEKRLYPEEALFLHMRGLLQIEAQSQTFNKPVLILALSLDYLSGEQNRHRVLPLPSASKRGD